MNENPLSKERYQNYLLVEGSDDKHVFHHLLDYYQIRDKFKRRDEPFEIIDHQGIDNLLNLKTIRTYLKGNPLRRFGIVVDADTDLAVCWQRIQDILERSGYTIIPREPHLEGIVIKQDERPIVGIWLMPDNNITGMIEHFVSFLRPSDDILWPMAEDVVLKVVETKRHFPEGHEIKAELHTWLAWQKEPGKPLGQAITARYLDADAPHAQHFMDWIRKLFDLETV